MRRVRYMPFMFIFIFAALLVSCSRQNDPITAVPFNPNQFSYWKYDYQGAITGDSIPNFFATGVCEVLNRGETTIPGVNEPVMRVDFLYHLNTPNGPDEISATNFYLWKDEKLFNVGYRGLSGSLFWKRSAALQLDARGRVRMARELLTPEQMSDAYRQIKKFLNGEWRQAPFRTDSSDTVVLYPERRVVYDFPFVPGKQWVNFRDPWLRIRKVEDFKTVQVPAGVFKAARIRFLDTMALDAKSFWFDYVGRPGLALRNISFHMILTTISHPDSAGEGWFTEQYRLTDIY